MATSRIMRAGVVAASIFIAGAPTVLADQPGQAAFPAPNSKVGGVKASLPGPRLGTGRGGTLLNRGRTLLPPSPPRVSGGSVGWRTGPDFSSGLVGGTRSSLGEGGLRPPSYGHGGHHGHHGHGGHHHGHHHHGHHHGHIHPTVPWWGWGWGYNDRPQVVYSGPWTGTDPFVTDAQAGTTAAPSQPPRELTPIERADLAWRMGRHDQSVNAFKDYLAGAPDDTDAMRYLAMVYIDQKKIEEAVALLALAYERTPALASRPIVAEDVPGGEMEMRKRVLAVSSYANKAKTASSWLALAVLIQAEGRESTAERMVEKAKAAGLNEKVASEFEAALKR